MASLMSVVGTVDVKVQSYQLQLNLQTSTAQIRKGLASYPIKASQGQLMFVIQTSSEVEFVALQQYIRKTHIAALDSSTPTVRFFWASQGMDYEGFIINSPGGNERFNFAPTMSVTMMLSRDLINTDAGVFSKGSGIADLYDGEVVIDTAEKEVFTDSTPFDIGKLFGIPSGPAASGDTTADTAATGAVVGAAIQNIWVGGL